MLVFGHILPTYIDLFVIISCLPFAGNMGNYAQEASGYGPQRVNYNSAAGYNQPGGQGQYQHDKMLL